MTTFTAHFDCTRPWIQNRRPTLLDADPGGNVELLVGESFDCYRPVFQQYQLIDWKRCLGDARWRHTQEFIRLRAEDTSPKTESKIPASIAEGIQSFYVLVAADDSAGEPIVLEHQVADGVGLQAVLRRQRKLGGRLGLTYVAECRIIPELAYQPQEGK
jgi:hypothetical protein